jgi:hypothetical protein
LIGCVRLPGFGVLMQVPDSKAAGMMTTGAHRVPALLQSKPEIARLRVAGIGEHGRIRPCAPLAHSKAVSGKIRRI